MKTKNKNVNLTVENALCTGCGACARVCPVKAIEMIKNTAGFLVPDIRIETCTDCGLCIKICAGINNVANSEYDLFKGKILSCHTGYAVDEFIRKNSQSGGLVTAVLKFLLESKEIDFAIINSFNSKNICNEPKIASTFQDLADGMGSFYCQSSNLAFIPKEDSSEEYAIVTLGCQSQSLMLMTDNVTGIKKPKYVIGLFCAGNHSTDYIKAIFNKIPGINYKNGEISHFRFRDKAVGGWPGEISFKIKDKKYTAGRKIRLSLKPAYKNFRCDICHDQLNGFADIAVGDPWGVENRCEEDIKLGCSVVITRTEKGKTLLEKTQRKGYIQLNFLDEEELTKGQTIESRLKPQYFANNVLCKEKGFIVPEPVIKHDTFSETSDPDPFLKLSRSIFLSEHPFKIKTLRELILLKTTYKRYKNAILKRIKVKK